MKKLLLILLSILAVWTIVAIALIPKETESGKTPLIWTTGAHPQRYLQVDAFNDKYPEYDLQIDTSNADVSKVIVQSSAGIGPDLIGMIFHHTFGSYLRSGILMDVTEEARRMGFGPDSMPDSFRPMVMRRDPRTLEWRQFVYPGNVFHHFIIYNKDIFDRYGVPYPPEDLTWEEYIRIGQKLTIYEDEGDAVPRIFGAGGVIARICIWQKGGQILNDEGTRCMLGEPEAVDGMSFFHDLFFKYDVEPTPSEKSGVATHGGAQSGKYFSWFGEHRLAMFFGARWMLMQFRRYFTEQREAKEQWEREHPGEPYTGIEPMRMGACLVPRFKNGKRYTSFGGRCIGVNRASPRREDALKFLKFLAGRKHGELLNEAADCKPANKECLTLEQFTHPDWPGEEEIHRLSLESIPYGRMTNTSMFISSASVMRIQKQVTDQVKSTPDLDRDEIARLMQRGADRINEVIVRNIARDPLLQDAYRRLLERGAEPAQLGDEVVTSVEKAQSL